MHSVVYADKFMTFSSGMNFNVTAVKSQTVPSVQYVRTYVLYIHLCICTYVCICIYVCILKLRKGKKNNEVCESNTGIKNYY